jgi:hypothetical protein
MRTVLSPASSAIGPALIGPAALSTFARRSNALMRASSVLGLNGLVR